MVPMLFLKFVFRIYNLTNHNIYGNVQMWYCQKKKEPCSNNHLAINLTSFRRYMYCFRSVCYSNAKKKNWFLSNGAWMPICSFFFWVVERHFSQRLVFVCCARLWRFITKAYLKNIFFLNIFGMKLWKIYRFCMLTIIRDNKCLSLRKKFHGIMVYSYIFCVCCSTVSHVVFFVWEWAHGYKRTLSWKLVQRVIHDKGVKILRWFLSNGLSFIFYCQPFSIIIKLIRSYSPLRRASLFCCCSYLFFSSDSWIWIMNDNNGKNQSEIC